MRLRNFIKERFLTALLLLFSIFLLAFGGVTRVYAQDHPARLVDDAGLLDLGDFQVITEELDEVSEKWQFDVVIVTVNSLDGKTAEAYADDYYDYNGYGYGDDKDGILFLVAMDDREWHISTTGYGITAFTDDGIDYMGDQLVSELSDEEYKWVFDRYVSLCDQYLEAAENGEPYGDGHYPLNLFSWGRVFLSLLVGFVLAIFWGNGKAALLKSVKKQEEASHYKTAEGLKLTNKQDRLIGQHVTSHVIEKDSGGSGGGGSSTHTSSSGTSHGGGGGHF